jgi:hypothetical protein
MLVLRQVLMSENPKITPLELENIISELFGTLVKLLDNSREAGTEEIVEAMMSSSASAGTSSDEKIQSRRQIITRVFLKSLQADDVVFKKVSRAVHCAFRGVVLGGSGPKGQKLAEAALRRVGAGKLVDQGGDCLGEGPWPVVQSARLNMISLVAFVNTHDGV